MALADIVARRRPSCWRRMDRRLPRRDQAARPPHHDQHHRAGRRSASGSARVEVGPKTPRGDRAASRCRRSYDRGDDDADLAAEAAEHDDREDRGTTRAKLKLSGEMKPWRVAKNEPAKPANIAPMAKAVSLVLVVLMPSERQAISSSRSASHARPTGSLRSRARDEVGDQREDEDDVVELDDAVVGRDRRGRRSRRSRRRRGSNANAEEATAGGCWRCRSGRR